MTDDQKTLFGLGYVVLAAVAGAFTALGFARWKDMTRMEIALTLVGGFSFAIFVTPYVAHELMGVAEGNVRVIAALTYVMGSGSNILLPLVIRRLKALLGTGDAA